MVASKVAISKNVCRIQKCEIWGLEGLDALKDKVNLFCHVVLLNLILLFHIFVSYHNLRFEVAILHAIIILHHLCMLNLLEFFEILKYVFGWSFQVLVGFHCMCTLRTTSQTTTHRLQWTCMARLLPRLPPKSWDIRLPTTKGTLYGMCISAVGLHLKGWIGQGTNLCGIFFFVGARKQHWWEETSKTLSAVSWRR